MKAGEIFFKTMPFVMAKLLLGLITVLLSAILFGILLGIAWLFFGGAGSGSVDAAKDGGIFSAMSGGMILIMLSIWVGGTSLIRFLIMHYLGYLVKAGHIAVIAEAVTTGRVPDNQVSYGKRMVTERFATSNIYFLVDKLVGGAVKQIQKGIGKLGNTLNFIPGMKSIAGLAQFFVELSLGYVDECCLGYTFYKKDQGACKSAADGVVIYAQNWKSLLGSAAATMTMVILGLIGITLVLFLLFGLLIHAFNLPNWARWAAFGLALLIAIAIKFAFMDSFILTRTMVAYMRVAPTTVITFDLYGKLCGLSSKFKELFKKGEEEQPTPQFAYAGAGGNVGNGQTQALVPNEAGEKPVFCGSCGAKNTRGVKFCGSCGAAMP
jgi:hypothetical protein